MTADDVVRLKLVDNQMADLHQAIGWLRDPKVARPAWLRDEELWLMLEGCVREWRELKRGSIMGREVEGYQVIRSKVGN